MDYINYFKEFKRLFENYTQPDHYTVLAKRLLDIDEDDIDRYIYHWKDIDSTIALYYNFVDDYNKYPAYPKGITSLEPIPCVWFNLFVDNTEKYTDEKYFLATIRKLRKKYTVAVLNTGGHMLNLDKTLPVDCDLIVVIYGKKVTLSLEQILGAYNKSYIKIEDKVCIEIYSNELSDILLPDHDDEINYVTNPEYYGYNDNIDYMKSMKEETLIIFLNLCLNDDSRLRSPISDSLVSISKEQYISEIIIGKYYVDANRLIKALKVDNGLYEKAYRLYNSIYKEILIKRFDNVVEITFGTTILKKEKDEDHHLYKYYLTFNERWLKYIFNFDSYKLALKDMNRYSMEKLKYSSDFLSKSINVVLYKRYNVELKKLLSEY